MGFSPISFSCVDIEMCLPNEAAISDWLVNLAQWESCFIGRLNYHFCSDEHLLEMNRQHLDHDYYTDVITFDHSRLPLVNGDVFISVERVNDNAKSNGISEPLELYRVMAHGLLHLLGYADKTEAQIQQMREKESQALRSLP